ncbi:hypothetical protein GLYMA_11G038200v4 [Glycine max]|uniref:Uncharacterized protein n=2 Tax=Glycine subgen. Soja TaxID=1462606 RepID=A0A0R0HBQ8_SOYBN|nr:hypothetical protein GYH30_029948 [Glycine max]KRH28190.1 hypothetical protein GLYMA_11G038200v4 [Glycine max]RZB78198.1 hypothetical protein D0Y65_028898 [Glycine soja]
MVVFSFQSLSLSSISHFPPCFNFRTDAFLSSFLFARSHSQGSHSYSPSSAATDFASTPRFPSFSYPNIPPLFPCLCLNC